MNYIQKLLLSSILAGCCIGIGGTVYLKVGGTAGAVLFSIGLITVVSYKLKLYTGAAGFVTKSNILDLIPMLFGNIIGCILLSLFPTNLDVTTIIASRAACEWYNAFILAIGCGVLMTIAVTFAREGKWLPLLFAIPTFILCGFYHCIADAFYYAVGWQQLSINILPVYIATVAGNFVGCNIPRVIKTINQ
ncbi:MAG: formate/nitrite transporter family protein [Prevotella sp.]|nr:formate/nitrite transporter family protein [Candidatus Prevotella equi]